MRVMTDSRLQGEFYVFIVGIYAASHDIAVTGYSVQSADADAGTITMATTGFQAGLNKACKGHRHAGRPEPGSPPRWL